jgi:NADP-dependent 3-hydroxy acid dehydrogenase YdfG
MKRTWFITGISSGLGQALARAVLMSGDYVIGTLRNQEQIEIFNTSHQGKAIALKVDITNASDIEKAAHYIETEVERIDVLVNNAGVWFCRCNRRE